MAYPAPAYPDRYQYQTQVSFGGYDHRRAPGAYSKRLNNNAYRMDWWDDQNMTADYYPVLASRRHFYKYPSMIAGKAFHGMCSGDYVYIAAGDGIYHPSKIGQTIDFLKIMDVADTDKLMCMIGNVLVVLPDKKAYVEPRGTQPGRVEDMTAQITPAHVAFYNGTYAGEPATANCIQIRGSSSFVGMYKVGDAIEISGCTKHAENNMTAIIREIDTFEKAEGQTKNYFVNLHFYDNTFTFDQTETVYIVPAIGGPEEVTGYAEGETEDPPATNLSIRRKIPDLDILFAHENRLWGAGVDPETGQDVIYASALGDPYTWYNYDLTGTESWYAPVLDEGNFTGGCSFLGYPIFFKDNHIYKVYGSTPSDYQIVQSSDIGVEPGSGKSLAIAGDKLYYLSRAGVMCYSGSLPQVVSQPLGDAKYHSGIAASDGVKYWLCAEVGYSQWHMFCYDTQTGLWHRELCIDNTGETEYQMVFNGFAWANRGLYAAYGQNFKSGISNTLLYFISDDAPGSDLNMEDAETPVQWFIESDDFTETSPLRKWLDGIEIRAELEGEAWFSVDVKFNHWDEWQQIAGPFTVPTGHDSCKKSYIIPNIPQRADYFKIRLRGEGRVWIYSIAPITEQGSSWHGTNGG